MGEAPGMVLGWGLKGWQRAQGECKKGPGHGESSALALFLASGRVPSHSGPDVLTWR